MKTKAPRTSLRQRGLDVAVKVLSGLMGVPACDGKTGSSVMLARPAMNAFNMALHAALTTYYADALRGPREPKPRD